MKSVLTLLVVCLLAFVPAHGTDKNDVASFPRFRGFTVPSKADDAMFRDVAATGANAVRLMLIPTTAKDSAGLWKKMLANLPAQLASAQSHGLYVIVSLFNPPGPVSMPSDNAGRKVWLHRFWNDPASLAAMIQQAVETARVIAPYEGHVWLELKNEPLDWMEFPKIPHNWPDWSQKIVDAVRRVSQVPIVIQVGPGGLCGGFATFPKLQGTNLIYSVHNYQPHAYTHQGIKNLSGTDLAHPYDISGKGWPGVYSDGAGALWNKDRLRQELKPVLDFQKKNNVRIYVGEFGVARWAPNAADYLRDNIELFEEYGWDWTNHAFRESHIWSSEDDEQYSDSKHAQLSPTETDRARVLKSYLKLNNTGKK